jgi:hypothetical protein
MEGVGELDAQVNAKRGCLLDVFELVQKLDKPSHCCAGVAGRQGG